MSGSLSLLTDLYQLTMAQGYWHAGLANREAVFHLTFRKAPFGGSYAVAAGLQPALDYLAAWRFTADDRAWLATVPGADGRPLFQAAFLDWLDQPLAVDVDAVPEGTVVFPHAPTLRVRGPLAQAQLLETPLLNLLNFQTLIATKAARVCLAAGGPVLEFGSRRAQGLDGALAASRAAYVGGCSGTSNVLAGRRFGIPVAGTHAHAWVMAFDREEEAFAAYADAMPGNCVFLVDTYDTLEGVRRAIEVGRRLRAQGHALVGVRLDSGDLGVLARAARQLLDDAGFPDAKVIASNDLDEASIVALRDGGAPIGVWGVGTRLVTGGDQSALGGVYKLGALRDAAGAWQPRLKLSEDPIKVSNPGLQQVRRYTSGDAWVADVIVDELAPPAGPPAWVSVSDAAVRGQLPADARYSDLLVPVVRGGQPVYTPPALADVRAHSFAQLQAMPPEVRRLAAPARYPVGLEAGLFANKERLIAAARGVA
jgi:nicotinate phosphoribosyltransferase